MTDYLSYLDKLADEYGVPREQVRAIYELETSSGRNAVTSSAGAQGQMQLMPGTAREMGVTDINDPYQNLRGGVKYYAQQLRKFKDPALAAAAYNAGPGRVARVGGVPNIPETQKYVAGFRKMIGNQPAPQIATQPPEAPMDEEADNLGTGGLDTLGAADSGNAEYADWLKRSREYQTRTEQTRRQQFEQGKAALEQAYAGPSRASQLFAISQALLAPRPYKGVAGTMANLTEAFGGMSQQAEEAKRARFAALTKLQQSYDTGILKGEGAGLDRELKLIEMAARQRDAAAKANAPKFMALPSGGSLVDINAVSELPVLTPEQVRALSANPRNKGKQFRTADGRIMEIG